MHVFMCRVKGWLHLIPTTAACSLTQSRSVLHGLPILNRIKLNIKHYCKCLSKMCQRLFLPHELSKDLKSSASGLLTVLCVRSKGEAASHLSIWSTCDITFIIGPFIQGHIHLSEFFLYLSSRLCYDIFVLFSCNLLWSMLYFFLHDMCSINKLSHVKQSAGFLCQTYKLHETTQCTRFSNVFF